MSSSTEPRATRFKSQLKAQALELFRQIDAAGRIPRLMLYLDTCLQLAVLTPEPHSAVTVAFLKETRAPLAISAWTVAELHPALGLKVRTQSLNHALVEAVLRGLEHGLARGLLILDTPVPQDFRNAGARLRDWTTALRAADALHLAIASGRDTSLCSLDAPFVAAARLLGLQKALPAQPRAGRDEESKEMISLWWSGVAACASWIAEGGGAAGGSTPTRLQPPRVAGALERVCRNR